jgi:hypothetical protein
MGHVTRCRAPGCGVALSAESRSGVCRAHNHTEWCHCVQCNQRRGRSITPVHPPRERPGPMPEVAPEVPPHVRQVFVPFATSNSGVARYAPVSLPREPWEGSA